MFYFSSKLLVSINILETLIACIHLPVIEEVKFLS